MTFDSKNGILYLEELQGKIKLKKGMVNLPDFAPVLKKQRRRSSLGSIDLRSSKSLLFHLRQGFSLPAKGDISAGPAYFSESSTDKTKTEKKKGMAHDDTAVDFDRYLQRRASHFNRSEEQTVTSPPENKTLSFMNVRSLNDSITEQEGNKKYWSSCEAENSRRYSETFVFDYYSDKETAEDFTCKHNPETGSFANDSEQDMNNYQNIKNDEEKHTEKDKESRDSSYQGQIDTKGSQNQTKPAHDLQDKTCCFADCDSGEVNTGPGICCKCEKLSERCSKQEIIPELNNNIDVSTSTALLNGLQSPESSQSDQMYRHKRAKRQINPIDAIPTESTVTKDNLNWSANLDCEQTEHSIPGKELEKELYCKKFDTCLCCSNEEFSYPISNKVSCERNCEENSDNMIAKEDLTPSSDDKSIINEAQNENLHIVSERCSNNQADMTILRTARDNNCESGSDASTNSESDYDSTSDSQSQLYPRIELGGSNSYDEVPSSASEEDCFYSPRGSISSDIDIADYNRSKRTLRLASAPAVLVLQQEDRERLRSLYNNSLSKSRRSSLLPVKSALKLGSAKSDHSQASNSQHVRFTLPPSSSDSDIHKGRLISKDLKLSHARSSLEQITAGENASECAKIGNNHKINSSRWQSFKSRLRIGQNVKNEEDCGTNKTNPFENAKKKSELSKRRPQSPKFDILRKGSKQEKLKLEDNRQLYPNYMEMHEEIKRYDLT